MAWTENKKMLFTEDVEKISEAEEIDLEGICREKANF